MDFYEALGLDPKLSLDPDDLKKRFYERSRQLHPDRFSRSSPQEQQRALDMTALLNDAFRTLRNPITRAEYFLKERGIELSKDAPPELLEEVFELNMALEELRGGDDSARSQLGEAQARFAAMREEIDQSLDQSFAKHDAAPGGAELDGIRSALNRRRYISNLVREVEKEMNVPAN
ncbi:MAG: Fe-S protein assembly co-chaperone HscB [Bryobacteraceae bacterium]|jgi:molecular chaperone HscB